MQIRKAESEDILSILSILDDAREIMRENGNATQWTNGYPSSEIILDDIAKSQAFLLVSEELIVGYFCFITGENPDPNYDIISDGEWLNDKPYGVIHRLASGRKVGGIAEMAFNFAFSKVENVRVDTHHDNFPMQQFLEKSGFHYCGIIHLTDGSARDAFQKEILSEK